MSEIQEDNTPEVEGVVECPNTRQREFKTPKSLGEWLIMAQPELFQVQPTPNNTYILTWKEGK